MMAAATNSPQVRAEVFVQVRHQQHRRRGLARDAQQHDEIDVAGPIGDDAGQPGRAGAVVAHQFLDPGDRHRVDGGVDRGEQAAEADERESADE